MNKMFAFCVFLKKENIKINQKGEKVFGSIHLLDQIVIFIELYRDILYSLKNSLLIKK